MPKTYKTPPEYAAVLGIDPDRVRSWIRSGELQAVNVGDRYRPRFKISPDAIREFEERRSGKKPEKPHRRKRTPEGVIEFY